MARLARTFLRLEPLTDRITPAVTVTHGDDGVLKVCGDQRTNDIRITDDGTAAGLTVTVDGVDYPVEGDVTTLRVYARAGHDTVSYTQTGPLVGTTRTVEVFLGNGHDTFTADLGRGIDSTSGLTLRVNGGNGKDTLSALVGGTVGGHLAVEFNGNNGMDNLSYEFLGIVTGTLDLTVDGGNGVDTVRGNLDVQAGSTGTVTAQVLGRNGKDDLGLWVTGAGLGELTATDLTIHGGHGRDTFAHSDNVTVQDPWHR